MPFPKSILRTRLPLLLRQVLYNLRGGFLLRPLFIALILGAAGKLGDQELEPLRARLVVLEGSPRPWRHEGPNARAQSTAAVLLIAAIDVAATESSRRCLTAGSAGA